MFYNRLPDGPERSRIADRLLALKDAMEGPEGIPPEEDA
jgi:hypothetical protein